MPRPKIIREWIEMGETYLVARDKPHDQEITLFTNHCELREVAEQLNPPQEIIDGTDDVYLVEEEPAAA